MQTSLGLRKNATESKKPGLSFASQNPTMFFCFPIYLPNEKAYPTKQRCYCNSLSCNLLPQLIDNSATKGRLFFVDRQLSYSSLSRYNWVLAANDCRFQVKYFLERSSSFSLASASRVRHDNESWHVRQRAYFTLQTPTT